MQKVGDSTSTANGAGEFTQGQPGSGVDATIIAVPWLNAVQRELIHVVLGAGIALDPADDSQVLKAIRAIQTAASTWEKLANKPTTVGGFGITDAFTKTETATAIQNAVADLVASSPDALNTLKKLADALGNDPNFAVAMTNELAKKADKATSLAGYGILDAYTKEEIMAKISALSLEDQALRKLVVSGYKGLIVSATGTNALIAIKARRLVVGDGATAQKLSNVDVSINLTAAGLGGLDVGVVAASGWYGAWVATDGAQTAGIAALMPVVACSTTAGSAVITGIASTALMHAGMQFGGANVPPGAFIKSVDSPTQVTASMPATVTAANTSLRFVYEPLLPVGYVAVRVGAFLTDATANKFPLSFQQFARRGGVRIAPGSNVTGFTRLANGSTAGALVPVSVLGAVPPTAVGVSILVGTTSGVAASTAVFANASATSVDGLGGVVSYTNNNTSIVFGSDILLESGNLYYASNSAVAFFSVTGWEDDL